MAPSNSRSVNRCGHGHLACKFPINVTVPGVAATFAMALGTAITVAVLASLALGSRQLALKLGGANSTWANVVWTTCAIGGATVILLFGLILFAASLGPARPF